MDAQAIRVDDDPRVALRGVRPTHDIDVLYRAHAVRLVRLAAAITFDRDSAEEIVHDAFAGLQRRSAVVGNAESYLHRSVINLALKVLRKRSLRDRYRPDPRQPTGEPEIDETFAAILRLPTRQRAVVALRFWEDLSEAEIAAALGVPSGTVKSTLHRALRRLRKELEP